MHRSSLVLLAALPLAGAAHAQLLAPADVPALQAERRTATTSVPTFPVMRGHTQGLAPADPLAADIYRSDPKLFASIDLNPNLGVEATLVNPRYWEGQRYVGGTVRLAQGAPLNVGGFDLQLAARLTVPLTDRLDAFGKVGVARSERQRRDDRMTSTTGAASIGTNFKLDNGQTATLEVPLGAVARKALSGVNDGYGAALKVGF